MNAPDETLATRPFLERVFVRRFVYRHRPAAWAALCLTVGLWLVILGTIMSSDHYWWGLAIIAVGALESWIGYRLLRYVQRPA